MLPDLKTSAGFDALREVGYGFNNFDRPQNFKMQAEIVDLAIKSAGSLTAEPGIVIDTAYLVLDSLLNAPRGFEFFSRFPKEEVVQFCRLAVNSREQGIALPVVCPVCPDYPETGGFSMSGGIGYAADLVLNSLPPLINFFARRNLKFSMEIHVADVEVFNPIILEYSGETEESFLSKIASTTIKISDELSRLNATNFVFVTQMSAVFLREGLDYKTLHNRNIELIQNSQSGKLIRARNALLTERIKENDFDYFNTNEKTMFVDGELADYASYGDLIDGRAVILSPDASSAVPAYNFLRTGHDGKLVNPTIYLYKKKSETGRFL